jgi:hypothetical protein
LKSPVPIRPIISDGSVIVQLESTRTSSASSMPIETSPRPPPTIARAETRAPSEEVAPDTNSIVIVPGRYTSPASIAESPRICCR